jgi:hypothetical protein
LLPSPWRKKFNFDGYIPTLGTKAKLILECEAIEQNESVQEKERKDNDNNNNNFKKTGLEIPQQELKKMNTGVTASSIARTAALTAYMLCLSGFFYNKTWQTQCLEKKNLTMDKEASKKNCPFLRRTIRKEVNSLACKAGKRRVLGLYAAAFKRKQDKESKTKVAKRCAIEAEDSLLSKDSISANNM